MRLMIGEVVLDYLRSMKWKTYPVHLHVRDATPDAAAVTPSLRNRSCVPLCNKTLVTKDESYRVLWCRVNSCVTS
jgi:hypothetical protein